jgi:hypothetical protein
MNSHLGDITPETILSKLIIGVGTYRTEQIFLEAAIEIHHGIGIGTYRTEQIFLEVRINPSWKTI